jgi:7-keto-8-aminopelargonate synthetase-like enzyme
MRFTLPGFVYSVGLPPVIAAAAQAALGLIVAGPERVAALQANSRHFLERARDAGLATGAAVGNAIVPIHFPDLKTTMAASDTLLQNGIYAPPIVQVGVPKGLPRIRFFISANHTFEQINRTVETLVKFSASRAVSVQPSENTFA